MLSTFPQELIALISWENALKEKKKIVIEDSLERKKKTTTYLILHRIYTFLTLECSTYPEVSPKGTNKIATYLWKENFLFTGTAR